MSTQAERLVRIEHKDGRRYSVTEADFKHRKLAGLGDQTYQDAGFDIVSYEDGTAYEEGAEPTEYAIASHMRAPAIGEEETTSDSPAPRSTRRTASDTTSGVASTSAASGGDTSTAEASS